MDGDGFQIYHASCQTELLTSSQKSQTDVLRFSSRGVQAELGDPNVLQTISTLRNIVERQSKYIVRLKQRVRVMILEKKAAAKRAKRARIDLLCNKKNRLSPMDTLVMLKSFNIS